MSQTRALIDTLKSMLRSQGHTYADCARWLDLSEASVKRLFSKYQFSLDRLEILCTHLGMDFIELARQMDSRQHRVSQLSEDQEQALVKEPRQLLVAVCLLNHWPPETILESYQLSPNELQVTLGKLDGIGLIELMPGNRVRLKVKRDFRWRSGGPIERLFREHMQSEFLRDDFDQPSECRLVVSGMLSPAARAELNKRLRQLVEHFNDVHLKGLDLPQQEREGTTLLLAMRSWEPSFFARFRRD